MKTYTWQQKLRAKIFSRARLDLHQPPGFKAPTYWYLGYCPIHSYFEDYLHGFEGKEYLICPSCRKIEKEGK